MSVTTSKETRNKRAPQTPLMVSLVPLVGKWGRDRRAHGRVDFVNGTDFHAQPTTLILHPSIDIIFVSNFECIRPFSVTILLWPLENSHLQSFSLMYNFDDHYGRIGLKKTIVVIIEVLPGVQWWRSHSCHWTCPLCKLSDFPTHSSTWHGFHLRLALSFSQLNIWYCMKSSKIWCGICNICT